MYGNNGSSSSAALSISLIQNQQLPIHATQSPTQLTTQRAM